MFAKIKEEIKPLPKETVKLFNWAAYVKIAAVLVVFIGLAVSLVLAYDVFDWKNETLQASSEGQTKK